MPQPQASDNAVYVANFSCITFYLQISRTTDTYAATATNHKQQISGAMMQVTIRAAVKKQQNISDGC